MSGNGSCKYLLSRNLTAALWQRAPRRAGLQTEESGSLGTWHCRAAGVLGVSPTGSNGLAGYCFREELQTYLCVVILHSRR